MAKIYVLTISTESCDHYGPYVFLEKPSDEELETFCRANWPSEFIDPEGEEPEPVGPGNWGSYMYPKITETEAYKNTAELTDVMKGEEGDAEEEEEPGNARLSFSELADDVVGGLVELWSELSACSLKRARADLLTNEDYTFELDEEGTYHFIDQTSGQHLQLRASETQWVYVGP